MTEGEKHLQRVLALPDDYPNKDLIVQQWRVEVNEERIQQRLYQEQKEYERLGLTMPF